MALASTVLSTFSFFISIIAVIISVITIRKGNKNSSASILVTLNESFAQAWRRFLHTENPELCKHELAELMNIMEISCAIHLDHSLVGRAKVLSNDYIKENLNLLDSYPATRNQINDLQSSPDTFSNIKEYKKKNKIAN